MFVLKPTSNFRLTQDAGTDANVTISGYDYADADGLGVPFLEQLALSTGGVAPLTTPAAGHSKAVVSIKLTIAATQRTITMYMPEDGTTQSAATQWGTPIVLAPSESAEYTDAGWTTYDSNGIAKYSSATMPRLLESAAPGTPTAGSTVLYVDTTGLLHQKDDTGLDLVIPESGMRDQNVVINGNFDYAQRQAPGTLTTYSNTSGRTYGADRWGVTNENASIQYIRTDTATTPQTGLNSRMFGTYSKITSTGKLFISQVVAGSDCLHLRGRTVRLQMKLKASAAKTLRVFLIQNANAATLDAIAATFISVFGANTVDPTFGTNLSKIAPVIADNATIASSGLSCSVTTAWQRFGATFLLPTDYKNLVAVVGTDSQFAAADSFSISEVGLYDGGEIREWAERMQAQQFANCQRYYCTSFAEGTAPVQNGGVVGCITGIAGKAGATALAGKIWVNYPVTMFKLPTVTIYCPTEASAQIDRIDGTTPIAHTATAQLHNSTNGFFATSTGTTNTGVGDTIALHYAADAEI